MDGNPAQPLTLRNDSPCAEENNAECGQIGAFAVGCLATAVPEEVVSQSSWSTLKALY
jgi:hypothetical protein